jgi:hypothetical protein
MFNPQSQRPNSEISPHIHWGHFGTIFGALVLLLGMTWLAKPQLFDLKKSQPVSDANVPHYYAYITPPEDMPQPEVLGASTDQGPSIINEDGSVTPIDSMGQVLGASTQDPAISLDSIMVTSVPDSSSTIAKYLSDDKAVEVTPIEDSDFETAISSGDPDMMNQQAAKMTSVLDALQKLVVPAGFVQLDKLKIVEYNSAIALLKDYPQLDQNPQLVGQDLQQFMQSQQNLSDEITNVAQQYNLDPDLIGPPGEAATLAGVVQGATQGAQEAATTLAQTASSSEVSSLDAGQVPAAGDMGDDSSDDGSFDASSN